MAVIPEAFEAATASRADENDRVARAAAAAGAAAVAGAGAMYLLDQEHGARRRALLRDRLTSAASRMPGGTRATLRDIRNRATGVAAQARGMISNEPVLDEVLVARVRATLGRRVRHARAIEVHAAEGIVALTGPILQSEHERALATARGVRGVIDIEDELTVHEHAADVPGLQGDASRPPDDKPELMQENWSPTARVLTVATGTALTGYGLLRRGIVGTALAVVGLGLAARGATNMAIGRVTGLAGGRRGIDVRKTIHVNAPVADVFAVWSRFEDFPRFMSHVESVTRGGEDRSRWVIRAPAGEIAFEAETTKIVENEVIAWKTLPNEPIAHAGFVRFDADAGGTRVDVQLTYNPPAGLVGHTLLTLLGHDPKKAMDDDLLRMKSLIEHGRTTTDGETVERKEVTSPA
jgi:uncharacterized membrane protein/osmotically-inducible protein OsmY